MDWIFIILGFILILLGILGCFIPILPGPPLSYLGVILLQFKNEPPFSTTFLVIWGGITLAVTVIDYVIPAYGTKRYGGSRTGMIGSMIGLFVGLVFFPPFGIIFGPLAGALLGEFYAGKSSDTALRSAWGSFVGFMIGTFIKLIVSLVLAFYFFTNIF